MLTLNRIDPHPELSNAIAFHPGDLSRAAVWVSGAGPWDEFLARMPDEALHCSEISKDGKQHPFLPREHVLERTSPRQYRLLVTFGRILRLIYPHISSNMRRMQTCAIILRPNAYIHLTRTDRHTYVPLPGVSAHQEMADAAILAEEFPDIFGFA